MAAGGVPRPSGGFTGGVSPSSCAMMSQSIHLRRASLSTIPPAPIQPSPGGTKHMHSMALATYRGLPPGVSIRHGTILAIATNVPRTASKYQATFKPMTRAERARLVTVPKWRHWQKLSQCLKRETSHEWDIRATGCEPHPLNPDNLCQCPFMKICTIPHATLSSKTPDWSGKVPEPPGCQ